jgi:hypothetical protein
MDLSRHFSLAELIHSDTAERERIANQPGAREIESLKALCTAVLDPLRDAIGRPIQVNSGYRGPALNQRIGGAANSQHVQGQAADIQSPGTTVLALFQAVIRLKLPYDQIIFEAQSASVQWVHVSHVPGANRGEIRVAEFGPNGKPSGYPSITREQALAMAVRVSRSRQGPPAARPPEAADEPEHEPQPPAPPPAEAAVTRPMSAKNTAAPVVAAKKLAAKQAAAQTVTAKKVTTTKVTAKKVAAKKVAATKAAAKKLPVKKTAAR